jgi:hypothetical protein
MSIASSRPRRHVLPWSARRPTPAHLALTVWWRATEFDRRLAAGENPWTSEALALRARRLTTPRSRARVARGLTSVLRSAGNDAPRFTAAVHPNAPDVLDGQAVIVSLERRLRGPGPVAAQGVAIIRLLLIDGNGPLYRPSDAEALRSRLRAAAAALREPVTAR